MTDPGTKTGQGTIVLPGSLHLFPGIGEERFLILEHPCDKRAAVVKAKHRVAGGFIKAPGRDLPDRVHGIYRLAVGNGTDPETSAAEVRHHQVSSLRVEFQL